MGLYLRGETWWILYYYNGKRVRESSESGKKKVAENLLIQRKAEIGQGKIPGTYFQRVTLKELAEDFLADYRRNERKSIDRAERSVRELKKHFGADIKASEINSTLISRYIDARKQKGAAMLRSIGSLPASNEC